MKILRREYLGVLVLIAMPLMKTKADETPAARSIDFNREIRPILSESCFTCHGFDKNQRKAGLRLDSRDGLLGDRPQGAKPVVVPGHPEESELFDRIHSDDAELQMPPPGKGKALTPAQVQTIRLWIDQGAEWKGHWSYIKPVRPEIALGGKAGNPIDAFLSERWNEAGVKPSPEAPRNVLIRRLSFDLTGLPPTPAELHAFEADPRPDAYDRLVDRLLGSPRHGERMAAWWLDLVRFADTAGYHSDNPRNIWPYRDYVIDAFTRNLPFDRFTAEQIAGDLLPDADTRTRVGSGYNRLLQTTEEGGAQAKEYIAKYASDRVRNASTVWLGSTVGCAECHDHKYDPFRSKDFYRFAAFFADIDEASIGARERGMPVPTGPAAQSVADLDAEIARCKAGGGDAGQVAVLEAIKADLLRSQPTTLISRSATPRVTRILARGNWMDDSGEVVQPGLPSFLASSESESRPLNRLDLASWVTSRDNPLTARVYVNRLWKLCFGQGLSKILDDLGSQGEWPTHPHLLDWLAVEFMDSGWDSRHMIRLMVTSNAYKQASRISRDMAERDPYNRLIARQARFRLDAEMVRDNALAVSGLLVEKVGGPSVKPYQPEGYWDALNFPVRTWEADRGESQYRRGLYTFWQRTFPHPSLMSFDAPSREECTAERSRSNIPQQALALLNDPSYVEASRALAERIVAEGGPDMPSKMAWAFDVVLSRRPSADEARVVGALYEKHLGEFRQDQESAKSFLGVGQRSVTSGVGIDELAAWTSVARTILNLHESITRP